MTVPRRRKARRKDALERMAYSVGVSHATMRLSLRFRWWQAYREALREFRMHFLAKDFSEADRWLEYAAFLRRRAPYHIP